MSAKRLKGQVPNFGIGEWYGHLLTGLDATQRRRLYELHSSKGKLPCPFKPSVEGHTQHCHKAGGVCSFRAYVEIDENNAQPAEGDAGKLRVACPSRFLGSDVEQVISKELIGTEKSVVIREVGFLTSEIQVQSQSNEQIDLELQDDLDQGSDVGRIDLILRNPENGNWCAVEHQAVYFSGSSMAPEFSAVGNHATSGLPFPTGRRRPDYRSSGPKRLMPQLQIKVPTLRRWGKKMAVVVDESFFSALGAMDAIKEQSNSDIVWVIVELTDEGQKAKLSVKKIVFTTLERAVEGLTAGKPVSLPEFENRLKEKLDGLEQKHKELLKKLMKESPHSGL